MYCFAGSLIGRSSRRDRPSDLDHHHEHRELDLLPYYTYPSAGTKQVLTLKVTLLTLQIVAEF